MTRDEVIKIIFDIIHEIAPDEDLGNVDPEIPLREQMDLDSMDFLDIVMELRKRYGIEVPEEDYMELTTLNKSITYLQPRLEQRAK